ncbi:MAG: oxygenase MpaB family protein [Turneriella sp.]
MYNAPTRQQLIEWKSSGDDEADRLIEYTLTGRDLPEIVMLMRQLRDNNDPVPVALPAEIRSYLQNSAKLPAWADAEKIRAGQALFSQYGPQILMVLGFKALPQCYACGDGAEVLYQTGRLDGKDGDYARLARRLMETSQFVIDTMAPDAFTPEGRGLIVAAKIRLIHAAIRFYLKARKIAVNGTAISQTYLAGTLMAFSALTLQGLSQMEMTPSPAETDGYIHCWRIVGHVVGLRAELLPENYEQATALGTQIFDMELKSSDAGKELTKALLLFYGDMIPGKSFDIVAADLMRFFLGTRIANVLAVQDSASGDFVTLLFRFFGKLLNFAESHSGKFRSLFEKYTPLYMQAMLNYMNPAKQVYFDIPPSLKENWKIGS